MTRNSTDRLLLAGATLLAIVAIGVLWQFKDAPQFCPAIYPVPDWCTGSETRPGVIVAIGLVLSILSATYVVYFTTRTPRIAMIILAAGIGFVCLATVFVVVTTMGGVVTPPIPID